MKYRKIRKQLTPEQAKKKIQLAQISINNLTEEILTYQNLGGKLPIGIIGVIIINDYGNLDKAYEVLNNKIKWNQDKIEDLTRFI